MKRTTEKRVVSKAEYARIMARKGALTVVAVGLLSNGILFGIFFLVAAFVAWRHIDTAASGLLPGLLMGTVGLLMMGVRTKRKVENVEEVQPATRKSVETLPSEDILVRGSDAPQTPEAVLLRAAATTPETPQEQLLRPSE